METLQGGGKTGSKLWRWGTSVLGSFRGSSQQDPGFFSPFHSSLWETLPPLSLDARASPRESPGWAVGTWKQMKRRVDVMSWIALPRPPNSYIDALTPSVSEYTTGDRIFKELIQLKWSHRAESQPNMTAVLMKDTHTHKPDQLKTRREDGRLQVKERDLRRNQPYWHLGLELAASITVRKYISVV